MKNLSIFCLLALASFFIFDNAFAATDDEIKIRYAGTVVAEDLEFETRWWYVEPQTQKRYPLKDGLGITRLLKKFGQGIHDYELNNIATDINSQNIDYKLTHQWRGQFLTQIDAHGEAWYINPLDNYRYKIDNGQQGLETLKDLALDISADKLKLIPIVDDDQFIPLENLSFDFSQYWQAWDVLKKYYYQADKLTDQDLFYGSLAGLANSLDDPYTQFFSPADNTDFTNRLEGSLEGIGAMVDLMNGIIVVISPLENSPAQVAGLQSEDHIIAVNGQDLTGATLDDSVSLIKGPANTKVTLTIYRPTTDQTFDLIITRAKIDMPLVTGEKLDNNIAYFKINMFSLGMKSEFDQIQKEIIDQNTTGVIVDLRNNPGGYTGEAIDLAEDWLKKGQMIFREKHPNHTFEYSSYTEVDIDLPTIILVNNGTASASEIFTSALQEHGLATVVGQTTFGKGTGQTINNFPDGSMLKYTIFEWFTPNDISLENRGVKPDYIIKNNQYIDHQLKKAQQLLN